MYKINPSNIEVQDGASAPSATRQTVQLRSVSDLVAAIPTLLGFRPVESLVAILLNHDNQVACCLRVDLAEGLLVHAERLADIAVRADAERVVIAVYTEHASDELPSASEVADLAERLGQEDVRISEAFLVCGGRFWSYTCRDGGCCPSDGTPVPNSVSELEAVKVSHGALATLDSRAAVQALYRPRPELAPPVRIYERELPSVHLPLLERFNTVVADIQLLVTWLHDEPGGDLIDCDGLRARLGLLLCDVVVRDFLLGVVVRDSEDLAATTRTLTWLALTASEDVRPFLAATAATLELASGQNPVAVWCLIDLAQGISLAELLTAAMDGGVEPQRVQDVILGALEVLEQQHVNV